MKNHKRFSLAVMAGMMSLMLAGPQAVRAVSAEDARLADSAGSSKWLSGVVSIEAGERAVYALKEDGTVWAWGGELEYGLTGNGSAVPVEAPVRMHIDGVQGMASGSRHTLLLKKDGTVWATGANREGQLGIGDAPPAGVLKPVQVKGLSDITAVAAAGNHSLALQKDGTVWQWGQVDRIHSPSAVPVKATGLPQAKAIAAGSLSSLIQDFQGRVWVWGTKLTDTNPDKLWKPAQVNGLSDVKEIAASVQKAAALQSDGTVAVWKNNKTYPTAGELLKPVQVQDLEDAVHVEGGAGWSFSAVTRDGSVWMWDGYGDQPSYTVVRVEGVKDAVDLANTGDYRQYALLKDGTIMEWVAMPNNKPTEPKRVERAVQVVVNGAEVDLLVPPMIVHDTTYVPLRGVFEHVGASIKWQYPSKVTISKDGRNAEIVAMDWRKALNVKESMNAPKAFTKNYTTMVPLRFIAETLGAKVKWDPVRNIVRIDMPQ